MAYFADTTKNIVRNPMTMVNPGQVIANEVPGMINYATRVPEEKIVEYDEGTRNLLNKSFEESKQSADFFKDRALSGVQKSGQDLLNAQKPDFALSNAALGMSPEDQALDNALMSRAQKMYNSDVAQMTEKARLQSQADKFAATSPALSQFSQVAQDNMMNAQRRNAAAQAQYQLRMSIVGNLMSFGGALGGNALGKYQNQPQAAQPAQPAQAPATQPGPTQQQHVRGGGPQESSDYDYGGRSRRM